VGTKRTEETKAKISRSQLGRKAWNKGIKIKPLSIEQRHKISENLKKRKRTPIYKTCIHCNLITTALNYGRWHGDKCKYKN